MNFDELYDKRETNSLFLLEELRSKLQTHGIGELSPIGGGYSNDNYSVMFDNRKAVLKLPNKERSGFATEVALLKRLENSVPIPKVLSFADNNKVLDRPFLIMEMVSGRLLSEIEDDFSKVEAEDIGKQLGSILFKIHEHSFEKPGFLSSDLNVKTPLDPFSDSFFHYINEGLENPLFQRRVDSPIRKAIEELLRTTELEFSKIAPTASLVHADFNQKNILVDRVNGKWKVTAILDWEFGFSGSPLVDFGNFLRFEDQLPLYKTALIESYLEEGGRLPSNWRRMAYLCDLASMISFLTRKGDLKKTTATALSIIKQTLSFFKIKIS